MTQDSALNTGSANSSANEASQDEFWLTNSRQMRFPDEGRDDKAVWPQPWVRAIRQATSRHGLLGLLQAGACVFASMFFVSCQ